MSPFSCQAKRGIKYFPSREASQQRGERASRKEKAGAARQLWLANGKPENDRF